MSGETGEDSGRGDREKKGEKKTGDGDWAGELRLKMGQKIRIFSLQERERQRKKRRKKTNAKCSGLRARAIRSSPASTITS